MPEIKEKYKKLKIDYSLSDDLEGAIDTFLNHINNESGTAEDCYRSEILFWLKDSLERKLITHNQYDELKRYYVLAGIYNNSGYPWKKKNNTGEFNG